MLRFRLRTLFLIVLIAAFGAIALSYYLLTRPPEMEPYSSAALQDLLDDGKTVVVVITADWSFSGASSRPVFMSPEVSKRIRELEIETLDADWTNGSVAVGDLLKSLSRKSVPTAAIYTPDDPQNPVVLSDNPSSNELLEAIERVSAD